MATIVTGCTSSTIVPGLKETTESISTVDGSTVNGGNTKGGNMTVAVIGVGTTNVAGNIMAVIGTTTTVTRQGEQLRNKR